MIDLILIGASEATAVSWPLGAIRRVGSLPREVGQGLASVLDATDASHVLCWDLSLGSPDPAVVEQLARGRFDVWHAGLHLGLGGQPRYLDFIEPMWLLALDAPAEIESTSWRLSLRAALIRTAVLRELNGLDTAFESLEAAGLELGHRWLHAGVFIRHTPRLLGRTGAASVEIAPADQLRFILLRSGRRWMHWAIMRSIMNGLSPVSLLGAAWRLRRVERSLDGRRLERPREPNDGGIDKYHDRVSILIPTLERYPYLRNELTQLRSQTVRPKDILICDQTPRAERESGLAAEFRDLPIKYFEQDRTGQCTGWNKAIEESEGEFVLLLGDDADRIPADFIEKFMRARDEFDADVVGCAVEDREYGLPAAAKELRMSDTLPIALIDKRILRRSGLYDYAFDRGARADADLAVRIHRAGGVLVHDPSIRVFHLRAPRGGLRAHKARVVTRGSSRKKLFHRDVASRTEIYLAMRHFGTARLRELLVQRVAGGFVAHGSMAFRILKVIASAVLLPHTLWLLSRNAAEARELLRQYPRIPELKERVTH